MLKNTIRKLAAAALLSAPLFAPVPALAQNQTCTTHDNLTQHLQKRFAEKQIAYGIIGDFAIMEVFVSEGGSWTIVVTRTNGVSCVIAAGEGWEEPKLPVGNPA